jgi:hypothetical protein
MKAGMTLVIPCKCESPHSSSVIHVITEANLFSMLFRWIFIPWLQGELDAYRDRVNNTAKRRDRNKVHHPIFILCCV